jgi:hypothetical protein
VKTRTIAALTAAATAALGWTTAAPAQAACATRVVLPAVVTIDRPYKEVAARLGNSCSAVDSAATDLYGPAGGEAWFHWEPATDSATDYWDVYDWQTLGAYKTRDGWAWDEATATPYPFTETTLSVKLGARAGITTARSGSYVSVTGLARRYDPDISGWGAYNTTVKVYSRTSTGDWIYQGSGVTGSDGAVTFRFLSPSPRYWRVHFTATATTRSAVSVTSYR